MSELSIFMPITKVDAVQRMVYGTLAEEKVDKSNEVFDYDSSKPYFKAWNNDFTKVTNGKSVGNLRSMHKAIAAGKFVQMDYDDANKCVNVGAKVVDPDEWQKVEEGVYTGFSVGGRYKDKWYDSTLNATRYTAIPSEGSLVDNPCMYGATFKLVKGEGVEELIKFVGGRGVKMMESKSITSTEKMEMAFKAFHNHGDSLKKQSPDKPKEESLNVTALDVLKELYKNVAEDRMKQDAVSREIVLQEIRQLHSGQPVISVTKSADGKGEISLMYKMLETVETPEVREMIAKRLNKIRSGCW